MYIHLSQQVLVAGVTLPLWAVDFNPGEEGVYIDTYICAYV
jgi:hypothetical protein